MTHSIHHLWYIHRRLASSNELSWSNANTFSQKTLWRWVLLWISQRAGSDYRSGMQCGAAGKGLRVFGVRGSWSPRVWRLRMVVACGMCCGAPRVRGAARCCARLRLCEVCQDGVEQRYIHKDGVVMQNGRVHAVLRDGGRKDIAARVRAGIAGDWAREGDHGDRMLALTFRGRGPPGGLPPLSMQCEQKDKIVLLHALAEGFWVFRLTLC